MLIKWFLSSKQNLHFSIKLWCLKIKFHFFCSNFSTLFPSFTTFKYSKLGLFYLFSSFIHVNNVLVDWLINAISFINFWLINYLDGINAFVHLIVDIYHCNVYQWFMKFRDKWRKLFVVFVCVDPHEIEIVCRMLKIL